MHKLWGSLRIGLTAVLACLAFQQAQAQRMSGEETIDALQDGGYVILMRQAPASLDAARERAAGGGGRGGFGGGGRGRGGPPPPEPTEEALEQSSIEMLTGMRYAIWHFHIPISAIYTSPTRPAREHAQEIPFADITQVDELGPDDAGSGWLAAKLREMPEAGTNTIIVTQAPNIESAVRMNGVAEGEALIVHPGDNPQVVGRLTLKDWSVLATQSGG
jgi:hypothetical protein